MDFFCLFSKIFILISHGHENFSLLNSSKIDLIIKNLKPSMEENKAQLKIDQN